jgi:sigma-B regulation protein RsbU (phosphoserine phosphatase)
VEFKASGIPFGVADAAMFSKATEEGEFELKAGDFLLLYSDGVIEAGPPTQQFGMARLKKAFLAAPARGSVEDVMKAVVSVLDAYLEKTPQSDDTTLVCLKIK